MLTTLPPCFCICICLMVIHQRVDATELLDGRCCDVLGRARLANIAVNQRKLLRGLKAGFLHAARGGDDLITAL